MNRFFRHARLLLHLMLLPLFSVCHQPRGSRLESLFIPARHGGQWFESRAKKTISIICNYGRGEMEAKGIEDAKRGNGGDYIPVS